jgi:competence protein ComEC
MLLGAGKYSQDHESLESIPERVMGRQVVVAGELIEDARILGSVQRFILRSRWMLVDSAILSARGDYLVTVRRGRADTLTPPLRYGMLVALKGEVSMPPGPRNPGEFNARAFYEANGIANEFYTKGLENVVVLSEKEGAWLRRAFFAPARRKLLRLIDRAVGGEEGEFLKGLLVGERSGIQPETNEAFARAGVAHVLAVSGSNVAVVAGFLGFIVAFLRCSGGLRFVGLIVGLLSYMLLSGTQPPVVRATVMGVVGLATSVVQERLNIVNALGLSALIILGIDARGLFDIGFQLSFVAVLSLVVLYPLINDLIQSIPRRSRMSRCSIPILQLAAVSIVATLGTVPLTATAFGRVSIIGVVANLAVVPAVGVSVLLGGVMTIAAPVSGWLAEVYGAANWAILRGTLWFTRLCADPSFASLSTPWFRSIDALPYYAGLGFVFSIRSGNAVKGWLWALLIFLNVALYAPDSPARTAVRGTLRVSAIDVGQGDALLCETPTGKTLLIDCGPAIPGSDAGVRHIIPFLVRRNIPKLDVVVITHGHQDHTGGLVSLANSVSIDSVFATPRLCGTLSRRLGRDVHSLARGMLLSVDSTIRCWVLSPSLSDMENTDSTGNNSSVVIRVQFGKSSFLFTGDAGIGAEERLVKEYQGFLRADVLKVGHHGSATSTSEHFLSSVRPSVAIVSVGKNNRFGHPSRERLSQIRSTGATPLRTDESGAIMMESDGEVITRILW